MKKLLLLLSLGLSTVALSAESITVLDAQGATHSGTPQLIAVVDEANRIQSRYQFTVEFKTGGFESIALRAMQENPANTVTTVTNAVIESFSRRLVDENDLVPVFSQGDSCWAVVALTASNLDGLDAVKGMDEIVVGAAAIGGAAHLTALEIGQKYNKPVRLINYKSSYDALVGMAANTGVNFTMERVRNITQYQEKNKNLKIIAMSCSRRHPDAPTVKTLDEYGIHTPYVWQQVVASRAMSPERVDEIAAIFAQATQHIGLAKIQELSDQVPPMFNRVSTRNHYYSSIDKLKTYREKFKTEIAQ